MSIILKSIVYSIVFFVLMLIYGGKVCPFVDSLPVWRWASILAAGYVLVFAARVYLMHRVVECVEPWQRGRRQFLVEMGLAFALGIGLTAYNAIVFHFPVGSGLKMLFGVICFGFFQALDLTLYREMEVARLARLSGERVEALLPFHSLTQRITVLASVWSAFNAVIIAMVVFKDIVYLRTLSEAMFQRQSVFVAIEIVFVSLVLLALTLRVLWSYARNLRFYFSLQTEVLSSVAEGELGRFVPVVSGDEFGRIARQTNVMIDGLVEKQRIASVFGKMVDPRVAGRLMAEEGLALGGERCELAIMIVDIRNFTPRTEHAEPEAVVEDLNLFFGAAVEAINHHGGMVDKFLGDGILAVFGLGDFEEAGANRVDDDREHPPADCALRAAQDLVRLSFELDSAVQEPIRIGVGLHMGSVIAGLIGSPERQEFTVIGDVVNTAARLESVTKTLGVPIAASCEFRKQLRASELKETLTSHGEHMFKGKTKKVKVWGAEVSAPVA